MDRCERSNTPLLKHAGSVLLQMETDFLLKHWPQVKKTSAMKTVFHRVGAHPGLADGES